MKRKNVLVSILFVLLSFLVSDAGAQLLPSSSLKDADDEATLQNWLGSNYYGVKIYTKSIDGASGSVFHQKCDGQGPTITLIRNTQNNVVFGGYSNGDWSGYPNRGGAGSFVFNLSTNTKLDYIGPGFNATYPYSYYGPIFYTSFEISSDMTQMFGGNNHSYFCSSGYAVCADLLFNAPEQSVANYGNWIGVGEIEVYKVVSNDVVTLNLVQPNIISQCPGSTIAVNYNVLGNMVAGNNQYDVQWSNELGVFATNPAVSEVVSINQGSGIINLVIPANVVQNGNYKVRLKRQLSGSLSNPINVGIKSVFSVGFDEVYNQNGGFLCPGTNYQIPVFLSDCVTSSNLTLTATLSSSSLGFSQVVGTMNGSGSVIDVNLPGALSSALDYKLSYQLNYANQIYILNSNFFQIGNRTTHSVNNPTSDFLCTGVLYTLNYNYLGCDLSFDNQFVVELSDEVGGFQNPISVGLISSFASSGTISFSIPEGQPSGTGYKIRVRPTSMTNGVWTSSSNLTFGFLGSISISLVTPGVICPGVGALSYTTTSACSNSYQVSNVFNVQLSDAQGSFSTPTNIGSLTTSDPSGTINFTIPNNIARSSSYKMRLVSTSPSVTSSTINVSIGMSISTIVSSTSSTCIGSPLSFTFSTGSCSPLAGNVYTLQSFSSSTNTWTNVSTLSSTATTGTLTYTIPSTWTEGYYSFRVTSSLPQSIGGTQVYLYQRNAEVEIDWNVGITGSQCAGGSITVPFLRMSIAGCLIPATTGNIYRVQISNEPSFINPVVIGSLSSTANSGSINATIPAGYFGQYYVRVIGTLPATNAGGYSSWYIGPQGINLTGSLAEGCPSQSRTFGYSNYSGCTFGAGNQIIYELGDASGNFTNPTVLATYTTSVATANHTFPIPTSVPGGLNYTIRVRSTNPAFVSDYFSFFIGRKTTIASGLQSNYCTATNYTHAYSYVGCALAAGNVFTAEICTSQDFSSPIYTVGSLASTAVTGNIVINIPGSVPAGNYFLRIKTTTTTGAAYTTYPIAVNGLILDSGVLNYPSNCGIPNFLPYAITSCITSNPSIQFIVDISADFNAASPVIYILYSGIVNTLTGSVPLSLPSNAPLGWYTFRARAISNGITSQQTIGFFLQSEVQLNSNFMYGSTNWSSSSLNTYCGSSPFTLPQVTYYNCGLTTLNQFSNFSATLKIQNLTNPGEPEQVIQTFSGSGIIPSTNFTISSNLNVGSIYRFILLPNATVWSPVSWEFIVTEQMTLNLSAGGNTFCPGNNVSLTVAMCSNPNSLNPLQVQLSNASGEFDNATVLSTMTFQQFLNPPFNVQLPSNLVIGSNYFIRIKDTVTGWTSNSVSISVNGALSVAGVAGNYCQGQTATLTYNYSCNLPANNQFEVFITNTTKANSILLGTVNATNNSGTLSIIIPNSFTGGVGFKFWIRSVQNASCQSDLSTPFGIGLNTSLSYSGAACRGIAFPINYIASGCSLNPGNVFQVMMGETVVGSLLSNQPTGTIDIIIPSNYSGNPVLRLVTSSPVQVVAQPYTLNVQAPIVFNLPSTICAGSSISIPYSVNCTLPTNNVIQVYNGNQLIHSSSAYQSGTLNFSLPLQVDLNLKFHIASSSYNLLVQSNNVTALSYTSAFNISATPDFIAGCGTSAQLTVSSAYPTSYSDNFETGPGAMWQELTGDNVHYTQVWVPGGWFSSGYYSTTYYYNHCAASGTRSLLFTESYNRWATTKPMNVSNGGTVAFKLKISGGAEESCENADPGEEVQLQYSLDFGFTWVPIGTYNTTGTYNNLTAVSVAIPNAAKSYGTMFRWKQLACDEYSGDNWVLDDVVITGSSLATFPCAWDNVSTLSNATIPNPIANPNSTTTYSVSITALNFACPVVKSINVTTANQIGVDLTKFTFFGTSGGKNYYSSDQQASWTTANSDCINSCGNLVSINSAAEQSYVQTILPNSNKWIGASDATTEGTFVWTTGQTFSTYINWVSGTTTATGNTATNDHVQMNLSTGKWQVGLGTTNQYYILEKPANQSIQISSNVPLSYCSGSQLTIGYTIQGVFDSGNVFSVQLSNAMGSFANPQVIGSVTADNSGTILVTLPSNVNSSSGYRMRIVSTSPAVISPDNGANILIVGTNPSLTSLSSSAAQSGNQLTLFGTGFASSGNTVLMSNQTVAIVSESSTQIVVVIPGGLCPGDVQVITGCGASTNSLPFDPLSIPVISSTSEAIVGGLIQVSVVGYGFGYSNNLINVSGTNYTPVFQSPNLIKFNLADAVCGQILTVTNSCGIVSNNFNYSTQLVPIFSGISPLAFSQQSSITISGSRFSSSGNTVTFGGVECYVVSQSQTSLIVQLPPLVCSGIFVVTNACGLSVSSGNYSATLYVETYYADYDWDGYGNINNSITSCYLPTGYVSNNTDCNDLLASVNPVATETCNSIDDDCDGSTDEGVQTTFYADSDGDTYGDLATTTSACAAPVGYVSNSTDCNDASASVHPGATETCNGVDDDCDNSTDEGVQTTFYADADGDTYGDLATTTLACTAPAGYVSNSTDCNDASGAVNPGATETCNNIDDDCDGSTDDGVQITFYADADGDTYGSSSVTTSACTAPAGYVSNSTDCNDASAAVKPGATETCNGVDDDCDGSTDDGVQTTFYADADSDTYGSSSVTTSACTAPAGYVSNSTDCNDASATVYPGATETCNNIDEDCDGSTDEGVQTTFYVDADNDTYGDIATTTLACSVPAGYSVNSTDCDDSAAGVNPGATEVCGGTDEDCDGQQNEGLTFYNYYADNDGDTYAGTLIGNNCFTPIAAGYAAFSSDCQDADPSIYPTAIELCYNIVDENCNGLINEGCGNLILGDDIYSSMSVPIANQYGTGAQPTSVLNLNMATDSPESYGAGSDMWILATPTSNAVRISLSGSTSVQDDNEISIYTYQPGLLGPMIPLMVEDAVQPSNLGVSIDGGNEVLLTDQLVPGIPIWICIRNTNGIPGVCKLQIANLQGSQTDIGPYTQYTGTYSNVCQNFKVKFRPKAIGYIVHRLESLDVNSSTSWLYAIPSGSGTVATTVCQLGKLVPANLTASSQTYYFKVDVNYSLKDAYGNDHSLIANGTMSGSLVLNPESDLFLRSTDQCPVYKSLTGSIATNRSVCGSSSYNWSFTQTLPSPSPFDFAISGATSSRILPISVIPGIAQNQVYDVKIRAKHLSNVEYTNWGSVKCLRTTASAGMPLVVEQLEHSNTDAVVYPNPNGGEIFFLNNFSSHDYSHCQLLNSNGQLVKNWNLSDGQSVFELNDELSSGIYQIRLIGTERTQMLRLIVSK